MTDYYFPTTDECFKIFSDTLPERFKEKNIKDVKINEGKKAYHKKKQITIS